MNYGEAGEEKSRSIEEWKADESVLFIGRRGSTTIGLSDANSDVDYFVVAKDTEDMKAMENVMLDVNLVTLSRFKHMLMRLSIETVEALFNVEYVAKGFEGEVARYREFVETNSDSNFLFWYQVWLMLKNQLKQYRKGLNDNKFGSKIYLYGALLKDDAILDYWTHKREIADEVRAHYFEIRHKGTSETDEAFIDEVERDRKSAERRFELRERSNRILNELEKSRVLD